MAESSPLYRPSTPFWLTTSLKTVKGLVTAVPRPAAYLLAWMTTLTVSMGWIAEEAMLPEREPTRKGLPYCSKKESCDAIYLCQDSINILNSHTR